MILFRNPCVYCLLLDGLVLLLGLSRVVALGFGPTRLDSGLVGHIVLQHLLGMAAEPGAQSTGQEHIVWLTRAPRVLFDACVSADLALMGAVLQVVTRNLLANPHLLGATSGAILGAVLVVLYIGEMIGLLTLPLVASPDTLDNILLVLGVANHGGHLGSDRLLLVGAAMSFMLSTLTSLLLFLGDHRAASSVLFWMLSSPGLARWSLIWLLALCVAGGLLVLLELGRVLNALMTGKQTVITLGLDTRRVRLRVLVCYSLPIDMLVLVSGAAGFVGLILSHTVRLLVGTEHHRLLSACALLGASFPVWMDVTACILIAPQGLPIGIATAVIGGLLFTLLLCHRG